MAAVAAPAMFPETVMPSDPAIPPCREVPVEPHALSAEDVLRRVRSDAVLGLPEIEVAERRQRYGHNELPEPPRVSNWRRFLGQFQELVIGILLAAAAVSGLLGEWADALAILAIVVLNGVLGFLQEDRAERALAALRNLATPAARVLRRGRLQTLPVRELVPGDLIELETGDQVPADARLVQAFGLRVQEAVLTGESVAQEKDASFVGEPASPLADRHNMVYLGTTVAAGKASAVVVTTGVGTELGRVAGMLRCYKAEPTPLQRRLEELGKVLAGICFALVGLIFLLEWLRGDRLLDAFLVAVSLAVAAVPEGLPAVVTIALALGLQRMARRNALIRRLPSVETLGCVTVICSDKTGTLTRNEMTVREILIGDDCYTVTGAGYSPWGRFVGASGEAVAPDASLRLVLTIAGYCNNARLRPRLDEADFWEVVGDPTEGALLVAARKAGIAIDTERRRAAYELPFDSERKIMSVVLRDPGGVARMHTKGAPEAVLARCDAQHRGDREQPLTEARRRSILEAAAVMASRALRVMAFAYRDFPAPPEGDDFREDHLIFAGIAGMIDSPREGVKDAVARCREAGIRPVMITGDHPVTALAVARELGVANGASRALTGPELDALTDEELAQTVENIAVYARVSPEHKLRIVRAWKCRGHVVAMTGDGVNDAPAVQAADIGIAMGRSGTDVTREAAAMVLTDDNFASIINAVEEGRGIYDNIQKVLQYLLSCNAGEILLMLAAGLVGWPVPLLPIQLLWINLVTDGLPALALALEPPEPGVMRRRPRAPRASALPLAVGFAVVFQGTLIAAAALAAFGLLYLGDPANLGRARAMAFGVLVYAELFRALAARSRTLTLRRLGLFTNPYLLGAVAVSALLQFCVVTLPFVRPVFESVAPAPWEWLVMLTLALTPATIIETAKRSPAAGAGAKEASATS